MKLSSAVGRASVPILAFFVTKIASGLILLKLSAELLGVADFAVFSQLLLLGALVTMVGAGGAQHGIARQTAAEGQGALDAILAGGAALWFGAVVLLLPVGLIGAPGLSQLLTGSPGYALAVGAIVVAALLSGPGQVACAALTGLRATGASLGAQAAGLIVGTGAAILLMVGGEAAGAAVAFYVGMLATVPIAGIALVRAHRMRLRWTTAIDRARQLLRFSSAFLFVAAFTAAVLFALRYAYLSAFDADALGYWLVAQRVSDTSTQLLGLFMAQYVIPVVATAAPDRLRPLLLRCWAIGTGTMLLLLAVFAAAPSLWVPLLLSATYLPAIGFIIAYMVGDVLRATASLAMHAALARSHVGIYIAVEVAATSAMAVVTLALIAQGNRWAPMIGYAGAYTVAALVIAAVFVFRRRLTASA